MGILKKLAASTITLLALVAAATAWSALAEQADVETETQVAADLGILVGEGNGLTTAYLNEPTTRIQAAILLLRLKGLEAEASAYAGTDNFSDADLVWSESQAVLAYLKANPQLGWAGTGDNRFDPLAAITAQQFYEVMLETLGYQEGSDFTYANTLSFAAKKGLYRVAAVAQFANKHIATAVIEALNSPLKSGGGTLAAALADQKVLDADKLDELQYTQLDWLNNSASGSYLADSAGMTLYYFTEDAADLNSCDEACLGAWPIFYEEKLMIPAGLDAADFGVFTRADGDKQITYKGWPLYYFVRDRAVGDTAGDGVGDVWYVINPQSGLAVGTKADLGNYLTDANGKTLYYFAKDTAGVSNCSGSCLANWPVFYSGSAIGPSAVKADDIGTLTRPDGTKQTTYKGFPLYYWIKDTARGDTTGQGVGDVWFVVDPAKFDGTPANP